MNAISGIGAFNVVDPTGAARSGAAAGLDTATVGSSGTAGASGAGQAAGGSFLDSLGDALSRLNGQLTQADTTMQSFAAGGSADIQTVMLQMQEASLGLQVGLQVRDRLLEAYNTIMRLQV